MKEEEKTQLLSKDQKQRNKKKICATEEQSHVTAKSFSLKSALPWIGTSPIPNLWVFANNAAIHEEYKSMHQTVEEDKSMKKLPH